MVKGAAGKRKKAVRRCDAYEGSEEGIKLTSSHSESLVESRSRSIRLRVDSRRVSRIGV